jgi:outer membrane murein-binding lipoprotein Lpp
VRNNDKVLILAFLSAGLLLVGCSHTIQEKKSTSSNEGDITQLKFTGSKVKLEHDF